MIGRVLTAIALLLLFVLILGTVGCGQGRMTPDTARGSEPSGEETMAASATSQQEQPPTTALPGPVVVPTLPENIPGYTELDPDTGLHITGSPQVIDLAEYRLEVTGKVAQELSLAYDEIRSMPKMTMTVRLVCPGFFEDTATWSGVPLVAVLEMAGVQSEASRLELTAADGYTKVVDLEEALLPTNFLAYELRGQPLPVLHGFPLRAVFPQKFGSAWVKWLVKIVVE